MRWGSRSKRNSVAQDKSSIKQPIRHTNNDRDTSELKNIDEESRQSNQLYSRLDQKFNGSSSSLHTALDTDTKNSVTSSESHKNNAGIYGAHHIGNLTISGSTTSINSTLNSNSAAVESIVNSSSMNTLTQNDNESISQNIHSSNSPNKLTQTNTSSSSMRPFNYDTYDSTEIKVGWLNKGNNVNNWTNVNSDTWRIYKAQLKGPVLSLYKVPADVNIKAFDQNAGHTSLEPQTTATSSSSTSVRQKRLSTASSRMNIKADAKASPTHHHSSSTSSSSSSISSANTTTPKNFRIKLKYMSEVYPHPDLQLNSANSIVSGTLESICHTILFNTLDDDKLSYNLLVILPLFGDVKASLRYFIEYGSSFSSSRQAKNKVVVSSNTDHAITQRMALVITTICDSFPGMLLDDDLNELVIKLVETLSTHNDELAKQLKKLIASKEGEMKNLAFFRNQQYQPNGSLNLTNVDNFLKLDQELLAKEINAIDLKFNKIWNPKTDASLLYELENLSYSRYNPLIFNSSNNVHYLGRLLVNHIFGDNESRNSEFKRSRILSRWIELGCYFDKIGDMVSWLAIATVICSMPMLRLKKTWSLVDERYLKIISAEWAPVVFELDRRTMISEASHRSSYHVIAPQGLGISYSKHDVVPYFGDLTVKYIENSTLKQCEKRVQRVKVSFSRWDEYLSNVDQDDDQFDKRSLNEGNELTKQLYNLLTNHVQLVPLTQESIMELSLSIEPNSIGQYHKLHYNSRTPLITGSYLPTLFTEVLPNYKLFDQSVLIGAGGFASKPNETQAEDDDSSFQKITGVNDVDLHSYVLNSKIPSSKQHVFLKSVRDIFNIGSDVFHIDDDLIFKSLNNGDEWKSSRPASVVLENPSSKRLSQISNNRLSQLSNSNTPSNRVSGHLDLSQTEEDANDVFAILDNSNLLNSLVKPLNVVLKAGTFEKLIDILVLTSNVFSKKINQKDIDAFLEKSNLLDNQFLKLNMNNGVFTSTFFATYRSFATTSTLLENLGKRFVGAKSGAISIANLNTENGQEATSPSNAFPNWHSQVSNEDPNLNWKFVGKIQLGILEALSILVSEHYADFTDDLQVKKVFVDILKIIDNEIIVEWKNVLSRSDNSESKADLTEIYEVLSTLYKKIRKNYIKKCYRPLDVFPKHLPNTNQKNHSDIVFPTLPGDFREAELFVEKLDWFINNLFSTVSISDWISVFQLLEIQTGKSLTSLFKYKSADLTNDDELEILNVFTWIKTLYGDNLDDKILAKFPPPVKVLFDTHSNLEKYSTLQISDTTISRDIRTSRMISLLRILSISRLRMSSVDLFNNTEKVEENDIGKISPHVPSFIETAITEAIVSPQSRAFSKSWTYSALTLNPSLTGENWDDLAQLLPNFELESLNKSSRGGLTPCVGWFVERLLEISCFVPNMSIENSKLINFDKRRFTYNCITNIVDMNSNFQNAFVQSPESDHIKDQFSFLFKLTYYPTIDFKQIKECASKENKEYPKSEQKLRFLKGLIESEQEKIKRDVKKREILENQERDIKRTQLLSQARASITVQRDAPQYNDQNSLRKARQNSSPSKGSGSSMGKRLGGLLKSVRPFSINVGSNWSGPDRIVHPDELPDVNSVDLSGKHSKPYQQIKLFNTKPLFVHSNIEGFFKIVGENGEDYCFQALNNAESQSWINSLNLSKRYTYLSKDAQGLTTSKVFGVPICDVCEREGTLIPRIVERLLQEIEVRGLDETGLYRIPGSVGSINLLKQAFDEGGDFTLEDDRWFEINTLAGCFKSYLRELPESLLTSELLPEFVLATKQGNLAENLKTLVRQLPVHNYHLLKRLFEHLNKVIEHSENNRMDAVNLAIVFSMSFINSDNIGASMGTDLGALQTILQFLIKDPEAVFNEQYNDDSSVFTSNE